MTCLDITSFPWKCHSFLTPAQILGLRNFLWRRVPQSGYMQHENAPNEDGGVRAGT